MDIYEHYLTSLTEDDMKQESGFIFYCNLGIDFFVRISKARFIARALLSGDNPVSYSDFVKTQKIRDQLSQAKLKCTSMLDETDLPYDSAALYINCMLDECNIITRTYLSKQMALDELCMHADRRDRVSSEDFNKLFLCDYPPEERGNIISFQNKMKERAELIYAQILVASVMGL